MCHNCNCDSVTLVLPVPLRYVTAGDFSVKTNMRQRLGITASCDYTAGLLNSWLSGGFNRTGLMCVAILLPLALAHFHFLTVCVSVCVWKLLFCMWLIGWVDWRWCCTRKPYTTENELQKSSIMWQTGKQTSVGVDVIRSFHCIIIKVSDVGWIPFCWFHHQSNHVT